MDKRFEPDFTQLVHAAYNREAARLPLYEHGFDSSVVEKIIDEPVVPLLTAGLSDASVTETALLVIVIITLN